MIHLQDRCRRFHGERKILKQRAGQTLEVRITARNMIGKVVRYKLQPGKISKGRTLCLPVGSKRPQRCT